MDTHILEPFSILSADDMRQANCESGRARCGTSIVIANFLSSRRINRKVYALDAFPSGFDIDELEEERQLGLAQVTSNAFNNRV
jgi:hypothetical protein